MGYGILTSSRDGFHLRSVNSHHSLSGAASEVDQLNISTVTVCAIIKLNGLTPSSKVARLERSSLSSGESVLGVGVFAHWVLSGK